MAAERLWKHLKIDSPKTILTVASYCLPQTASFLLNSFPRARLFNCYGPTETTIFCCWTEITKDDIDLANPLSVGHIMPGNRAWLYDGSEVQPAGQVPEGEKSELCISGDHVCVGYWNAPQLEQEKFLSVDGERIYRTGDLVSRRGDKFLYWGRLDDTIKIKGYRVNLGEIEHCIGSLKWVSSCTVVDIHTNEYQAKLVALYIPGKDAPYQSEDEMSSRLKEVCKTELPHYMIPDQFVKTDSWPLTASGKINRNEIRESLARSYS
jgi:D-alanine--poly(phosphoribitol) ligase subunit 1